jgi:2-keto-4-pentenoate hydratase/2-oxohepta-3-ene-1,7-dioic acid hydratase in catechol pathway
VTADKLTEPQALDFWLDVDGERKRSSTTRTMSFRVATLVYYVGQVMSLQSGDLILTGTPPGLGLDQKPHQYLSAGQTIHLGIMGLGVQQQRTVPAQLRCRA